MRILLLNQFYPPDVAATGQLLADLAGGLVCRGHEVHVVCSRRAYGGGGDRYPAASTREGARVHRVAATGFGRGRRVGRVVDYLSFYALATARALTLPRMDVCVGLTTPPFIGLAGSMCRRLRRTRLVLWTMDLYPEIAVALGVLKENGTPHHLFAGLSRRLYRGAARIVSLGEVMTERLIEAGAPPENIVTVHNWVPGEAVAPIPRERSTVRRSWMLGDDFALMYSGNLGLGHDLDTVLRALAELDGTVPARALFVGKGKGLEPLRREAARLGLRNAEFRPPRPLDRLSETLAAGDAQVVSQRPGTEGLIVPSKLYGALAAARPVLFIGPEKTEAATIVREGRAGIIVPPGDVTRLADAVRTVAGDESMRAEMGENGRQYYEQHFGRDRSVSKIADAVEAAASCPPHRPTAELPTTQAHTGKL